MVPNIHFMSMPIVWANVSIICTAYPVGLPPGVFDGAEKGNMLLNVAKNGRPTRGWGHFGKGRDSWNPLPAENLT